MNGQVSCSLWSLVRSTEVLGRHVRRVRITDAGVVITDFNLGFHVAGSGYRAGNRVLGAPEGEDPRTGLTEVGTGGLIRFLGQAGHRDSGEGQDQRHTNDGFVIHAFPLTAPFRAHRSELTETAGRCRGSASGTGCTWW